MASKSKRLRQNTELPNKTIKRIGYLSVFVFLVKLLIIWRISNLTISQVQGHIWLGADGENYLSGVDGLIANGFLSKAEILNYWPAGYPIVIYIFSLFGKMWTLTILSIVQTFLFCLSTYLFIRELCLSRLRKYVYLIFILVTFNPTLSLNSLALGYESLVASGFILIMYLILKNFRQSFPYVSAKTLALISTIFSFLSFMQPRFLLTSFLIVLGLLFFVSKFKKLKLVKMSIIYSLVIILLPCSLILRNHLALGYNTISTNLGITMSIGAGETNGSYNPKNLLPCDVTGLNSQQADSKRISCVFDWYVKNPAKASQLFINKSIYFWSPWFGPLATGTMNRNPWKSIHPLKGMLNSEASFALLMGNLGKLVSWLWLLGGLVFLFYGFFVLWRAKFELRVISAIAMLIVISSWLVTLISIGDHRFRLPIMGASLFLQAVGIRTLFSSGKPPMVQPPSLR